MTFPCFFFPEFQWLHQPIYGIFILLYTEHHWNGLFLTGLFCRSITLLSMKWHLARLPSNNEWYFGHYWPFVRGIHRWRWTLVHLTCSRPIPNMQHIFVELFVRVENHGWPSTQPNRNTHNLATHHRAAHNPAARWCAGSVVCNLPRR